VKHPLFQQTQPAKERNPTPQRKGPKQPLNPSNQQPQDTKPTGKPSNDGEE